MSRDTDFESAALENPEGQFSLDALVAAESQSLEQILNRLNAQTGVQRNEQTPTSSTTAEKLYVSMSGYDTLCEEPAQKLFVAEGPGARARPTGVVENRTVDQCVIHSFGYRIDLAALRTGAKSIQVDDRVTGYNPYKVYTRLQQVLFQAGQATTHLITRRGDIISSTPWNRAPAVNTSAASRGQRINERSISIELESWTTAYNIPFRGTPEAQFRIVGLEPYTDAQIVALGFLLKKLGLWTGLPVNTPLGFTWDAVRGSMGNAGGHTFGTVNYSAIDPTSPYSPGGEWQLPPTWAVGDPLPSYLPSAAWQQRIATYYTSRGTPAGAQISHYARLANVIAALPTYSFETELFEARPSPVYTPAPPPGGENVAAGVAVNNIGDAFARSERMQAFPRSGLYETAPNMNDAVILATSEMAARLAANRDRTLTVPVVRQGLAFDFSSGQWVLATSRIQRPE